MVPVAVRAKDDAGGGNAVGAILASLATDVDDPGERLAAIIASTTHAKQQLQGMSKAAILQYSALLIAPSMLQMIPRRAGHVRPTFNVVISNVPGPEQPLYFRGARLEATYPMSIPVHGQALNITCNSYAGNDVLRLHRLPRHVPHLQRLAVYCGEALAEASRLSPTAPRKTGNHRRHWAQIALVPGHGSWDPRAMETQQSGRSLLERFMAPIQMANLTRSSEAESIVRELFGLAGIEIGGTRPGDIRVHDPRFYERVLRDASIGFGESYMDGWWETDALDVTIDKIMRASLQAEDHRAAGACAR